MPKELCTICQKSIVPILPEEFRAICHKYFVPYARRVSCHLPEEFCTNCQKIFVPFSRSVLYHDHLNITDWSNWQSLITLKVKDTDACGEWYKTLSAIGNSDMIHWSLTELLLRRKFKDSYGEWYKKFGQTSNWQFRYEPLKIDYFSLHWRLKIQMVMANDTKKNLGQTPDW